MKATSDLRSEIIDTVGRLFDSAVDNNANRFHLVIAIEDGFATYSLEQGGFCIEHGGEKE